MPTPEAHPGRRLPRIGLLGGTTLLLAVIGTYVARGAWDTAAGVVTGAGAVGLLVLVARRRAARRGGEAATADRVFGGAPDERDRLVLTTTASTVGLAAVLLASVAPVAVSLGVSAEGVLTAAPYVLIGIGVVTFAVVDRTV